METPGSPAVPQLWELGGPAVPQDIAEQAQDIAVAEFGGIGMADRIRGWCGIEVRVMTAGVPLTARVRSVQRDAVLLADSDGDWLVPLASVDSIEGPPGTAVPPAGRERASGLAVARDWIGSRVRIAGPGGPVGVGELAHAGSDHVAVAVPAGVRLIPWSAIAWIRRDAPG